MIGQRFEAAYPLDALVEHPDNPRVGDEEAIEESMAAHGFYGAVLVQQSTGRIIAGNHRTRVARRRGETTVPVLMLDVDDDQARRILLVDNRTNDRATYDDVELARLLGELDGLAGTGFDTSDLEALLEQLAPANPDMPNLGDERYTPDWIFEGMGLTFDVDVAAPVDPAQRRAPALRYLTVHDDGLTAPWEGLVWMNPPYSDATAWARRWTEHPDGVCLITVSGSEWVPALCERAAVFCFVPGVDFTSPVPGQAGIPWPTFMAAQGAGTVGLARLAQVQNWPVFARRRWRPLRDEPMRFRRPA